MTKSTAELTAGDRVLTTHVDGEDFGIPLVGPTASIVESRRVARTVRTQVRCQGGRVVWFVDGTKTRPLHGRTSWQISPSNTMEAGQMILNMGP